jgi:hypothetical protein
MRSLFVSTFKKQFLELNSWYYQEYSDYWSECIIPAKVFMLFLRVPEIWMDKKGE